jgi:hypothetical protein
MATDSQELRQRRYRLHKSGVHDECKPERSCRSKEKASTIVESPSLSPREALQREFDRVTRRLDVLHAAVEARPTDVELSAEQRGLQRILVPLSTALGRLAPAAPVVPLVESPLDRLRRERQDRAAEARRKFAQTNPGEPFLS